MNITRFTDYALRTLIYLGITGEGLVTIKDVSESYGISKNHLMKVVQELSAEGYVEAVRGKNGGIRLNSAPNTINVGELVRKFEQESTLVECFGTNNQCVITPACELKRMFAAAMDQFFVYLEQFTLADLLGEPQLNQLLGTSADTIATEIRSN
ncbi:Rrf2 family transcriptional regulator [Teredinibacter turnerae]|uniref:Rrf2 family transcriptional regulator n=1 Tax=Teredinibacter turnerae TaxID=2426 RepID=UPI00037FA052|nr:Rrf2 family transcriptional regulator [Teredinibacter turnerae]